MKRGLRFLTPLDGNGEPFAQKKWRQTNLLENSPYLEDQDNTPARIFSFDWPSTTNKRLAKFTLNTPIAGVTEETDNHQDGTVAKQQVQEAVQVPEYGTMPATAIEHPEDDLDDFHLTFSQTYERLGSQETPSPLASQEETPRGDSPYSVYHHAGARGPSGPKFTYAHKDPEMYQLSAGPCVPATTPELPTGSQTSLTDDSTPLPTSSGDHKPQLFPIFRPKNERKFLCIIRHGESDYNRAVLEAANFADPMIFDPHLTFLGHSQARGLLPRLQPLIAKHGQPLWVVSPLTRCIQTYLDCSGSLTSDHCATPKSLVLLSVIAEHCSTAGDVGRPPSCLMKEFPQLTPQLEQLPESWWYSDAEHPNCALHKRFGHAEPKDHLQKRVAEFTRWLNSRQEKFVIAIGHCTFWSYFLNKRKKLRNCEMHQMYW